ncbi:MAG TPA: OsmC family protein [Gammaproteobacteria bacterium]|nr:OsmC family protein [Gammaproteobacteria bacterium]
MNVRVKWTDNMTFIGETSSGHAVVMDGPPDHGGRNIAVRPMEMVLLGLGGCTAFDVASILKKARQQVKGCEINVKAERADAIPAVFTRIHIHYVLSGKDLSEQQVHRAVQLSAEKYCSVTVMLAKTAEITHDYQVIQA